MTNHLFSGLFPQHLDRDKVCIRLSTGQEFSYGDTIRASGQLAAQLRSKGITEGDRVAIQLNKSPFFFFLYLACIRVGAIFVPLNTAYTDYELEFFLSDVNPTLLIVEPDRLATAQKIATKHNVRIVSVLGDFSFTEKHEPSGVDQHVGPAAVAAVLYTSGTTGRPKGAMLSHHNLRANAEALTEVWRMSPRDIMVHALPIYHAHGLFISAHCCLIAGAEMIFLPKFDAAEVLTHLPKASIFMGVPTFYTRLLEQSAFNAEITKRIRLFVSGSAPLLAATHEEFQTRTGHQIVERYGLTETLINSSNPYEGPRVAGSVGCALPGVEIRITDPADGTPVAEGETGVVEVRGPNVFSGYWGIPATPEAGFREQGYFSTGDLGQLDRNGYLWILGRTKDLVITGGYNVYPKEVELALDSISGVIESAVVGAPHADFGEAVTAAVVLAPDSTITEAGIVDALRGRLASYKLPKKVFFEKELPRNAMAKVQKAVLRERYRSAYAASPEARD